MNDQQLIDLVYEKSPGEFSADEISGLRARVGDSELVREALAERLRLERSLTETLATPPFSVAHLIAAAKTGAAGGAAASGSLWSWGLGGLGVALVVAVPLAVWHAGRPAEPQIEPAPTPAVAIPATPIENPPPVLAPAPEALQEDPGPDDAGPGLSPSDLIPDGFDDGLGAKPLPPPSAADEDDEDGPR